MSDYCSDLNCYGGNQNCPDCTPERKASTMYDVCPTCHSDDPRLRGVYRHVDPGTGDHLGDESCHDPYHSAAAPREESEPSINESSLSLDALHGKRCPLAYQGFLSAGQGGDDPCGWTVCIGSECAWWVTCSEDTNE